MLLINEAWIRAELGGLYGEHVVREMARINELYAIYDGVGQRWATRDELSYTPNRTITNHIKKLIKAEARFMMSRAPEIRIVPADARDAEAADEIERWLSGVLDASDWRRKLIQAARDCFIGKRVALKCTGGAGRPLRVDFRPAQEFVFETAEDDAGDVRKIVFFYQTGDAGETDRKKQRIWRQRYWIEGEERPRCMMDEGLYDGYGHPINVTDETDTGLSRIPCRVIINDGLTGDLSGESDVEALIDNQRTYNRLNSDDVDALRFNMFPMRYIRDATEESAEKLVIAPGALADIQSDPSGTQSAEIGMLESGFGYDGRLENRLNRTKNDMYELLSIPNISLEQLKGMAQSGKGMRGLYWELMCRCEEKWAEGWDDAIRWMAGMLIHMARAYGTASLPDIDYTIRIDHLYPIPDDEEDERAGDLSEVAGQARSRLSYIRKWQPGADAEGELSQMAREQALLNDAYAGAIGAELGAPATGE